MLKKHGISLTSSTAMDTNGENSPAKNNGISQSTGGANQPNVSLPSSNGAHSVIVGNESNACDRNGVLSPLKTPKQSLPSGFSGDMWVGTESTKASKGSPLSSQDALDKLFSFQQQSQQQGTKEELKSPFRQTPSLLPQPHLFSFHSPLGSQGQLTGTHQCSQCDKEFDSRLNLLQHQLLQHHSTSGGGQMGESVLPRSSSFSSAASPTSKNGGENRMQTATNPLLPLTFQLPPFLLPPQFSNLIGAGGGNPLDSSANAAQSAAAALMAKLSGSVSGPATAGLDPLTTQFTTTSSPSNPGTPSLQSGPNGVGGSASTKSPAMRKQYTSTSKNYCDICNKDVCNKYFLRTHMLKMYDVILCALFAISSLFLQAQHSH